MSSRAGPAYLPGVMPPHMPLAVPADYGAALGMSLTMPGFPMLSSAHAHPDQMLVSSVSKAAAAAACHANNNNNSQKSPSHHHGNNNNSNNNHHNNNNTNRSNGQLTKFTIDEILGKKDSREKSPAKSDVAMASPHHQMDHSHVDNGAMAALEASRDCSSSPGTQDENSDDIDPNARFSWLQCTRYRPPKLPRKYL